MKIFKSLMFVVAFVASFPAFSYETGSWTSVQQIYSKNDGSIYVYFGANTMPGCYNNRSGYLKGSDIDRLYSTVLAAFMGGKEVLPLYRYDNRNEGYSGWGLCYVEAVYVR